MLLYNLSTRFRVVFSKKYQINLHLTRRINDNLNFCRISMKCVAGGGLARICRSPSESEKLLTVTLNKKTSKHINVCILN